IDLVFPTEGPLENEIASLASTYWSCRSTLTKFIEYARKFADRFELRSNVLAVSAHDATTDSVFCLDPRGILSIIVDKLTYERLGIVGTKMRWKDCDDMYLIQCALSESIPDDIVTRKLHRYGPKQEASIASWDTERGPWHILYYIENFAPDWISFEGAVEHTVTPSVSHTLIAYVPEPVLPSSPTSEEEREDRNEYYSALFEWVGMACLGSTRLFASDGCDPYVAVYTPPCPSRMSTITHVRWRGLLSSAITHNVVGMIMKASLTRAMFAAVTIQGVPTAPVPYIPPSSPLKTLIRLPRPESEDTWSLLVSSHARSQDGASNWVLAESIGKWDSRWG
ncbi:hypothetical protein DAEQUDRAFT_669888, partial [Daedalea quercina L-15889]